MDRSRRTSVWLLPVRHDHERRGAAQQAPESDRYGDRRRDHQCVPVQHLPPHSSGDPTRRLQDVGGREGSVMINDDLNQPGLSRRDLLSTAAAATGALVVGFWMPRPAPAQIVNPTGAAWAVEPGVDEVNAWVVVAPDETVTVRIAQTELGQGVWTSNTMMVCEELQCDWSRVRPQYASANRDGREMAPEWTLEVMGKGATDPLGGGEPEFGGRGRTGTTGIPDSLYRRMRTNAAASVRDGRYYLQLAGAEARERLLLAAATLWKVSAAELSAKNSI